MVRVRPRSHPTIKEERDPFITPPSSVIIPATSLGYCARNRTRRDVPRQARRNPWMRSNQRPFARDIIAGRAYYVPSYADCGRLKTCRMYFWMNARLSSSDERAVPPSPVRPSTSAGNFADAGICRRRINSQQMQRREKCAKETRASSYFYIYREGRSFTGPWKEFRGNCARRTASSRWRKYCLAGHSVI